MSIDGPGGSTVRTGVCGITEIGNSGMYETLNTVDHVFIHYLFSGISKSCVANNMASLRILIMFM